MKAEPIPLPSAPGSAALPVKAEPLRPPTITARGGETVPVAPLAPLPVPPPEETEWLPARPPVVVPEPGD